MTNEFAQSLAPYAALDAIPARRVFDEEPAEGRGEYGRDRDRIIHCNAFRRLEYKTQVFVNHEGDLFRTRLTHSLEVAQIARAIARNLYLNEDLAEAISLAHDLGHTPFGHAGQDALNACMLPYGGFEHNLQSLRVVDLLEERYGDFNGLNLTFETREGILKHCSQKNAQQLGEIGQRFIQHKQPSLEAQLTNYADEIAYNNHDIDDGLRSGLIQENDLANVTLYARNRALVSEVFPGLTGRRAIAETVRRMINALVLNLIATSQECILSQSLHNINDVRNAPPLIKFSDSMRLETLELKQFLRENLYRHYQVQRMSNKARRCITDLFTILMEEPILLPPDYVITDKKAETNQVSQARKIADYIAGMTDRYALREHRRLFFVDELF